MNIWNIAKKVVPLQRKGLKRDLKRKNSYPCHQWGI